ncbi:MAG TPA: carboxypeptidase-like regulatory domain-containing protein, partial [Gemmatimonadaceae bacterium]
MSVRRFLALSAFAAACLSATDLAAQQTDVIRGRVIGPDSAAVPGVQVSVTSISGNVTRQSRTDRNGNFSVTFPNGDGDYMVSFSAMGFAAKRFEVKRTADQEFLLADTKLQRAAVTLDAVKVQQ